MAKVLLSVKDLKVYYPVRKGFFKLKKAYVKAVDGVSFDVYEGEAFGIVGESGCGKSTTAIPLWVCCSPMPVKSALTEK